MTENNIQEILKSYGYKLKKYEFREDLLIGKDDRGKQFYQNRHNIQFYTSENKLRTLDLINLNTLEIHLKKQ